jgi:hypothetical protein
MHFFTRSEGGRRPQGRSTLGTQAYTELGPGAGANCVAFYVCAAAVLLLCSVASAGARSTVSSQQPAPDRPVDPAVRDTLKQYEAALESLDADAVKKVQPTIDVDGLKRAFNEMRALNVDIDNVRLLSSDEGSARVSCRVTQTLTPKAGSRQTTTVTRVLRLRRQDSGWTIQSFER